MFAFATCDAEGYTAVYRLDTNPRAAEAELRRLWGPRGRRYAKVAHNMRFDAGFTMQQLGVTLDEMRKHPIHETMALTHLWRNDRLSYALDEVAYDLFGYPKAQDDATARYMSGELGLLNCPEFVLDPYQRADVERAMLIYLYLHPKILEQGYGTAYDLERRLMWVTLSIEDRGMMVDVPATEALILECRAKADAALAAWRGYSGDRSTPQSKSVGRVLERELGVRLTKKTKLGEPSTDKAVMEDLRARCPGNPLVECVLQYRAYKRGVSTLEEYLACMDGDGIIHPSIHPYRAKTGRESCSDPNLQNVAKETTLRTPYPIPARRCFRPKPGYDNVHIDYAGIEARLLTHFSGDPELMRVFTEGDGDFHSAMAAEIYGTRWAGAGDAERKSLRGAAKNCDFGLAYGAGMAKFARTAGLDPREGAAAHRRVTARYPSYTGMSRHFIDAVRRDGYITTLGGRRLYVPRNKPYMGTNYEVQGTAAEILKRGQVAVDEYLRRATGGEAAIILPIHDEIVIEWPRARRAELPACLREIRELMIDCPGLSVPLEVEVKLSTTNWASAEEYNGNQGRKTLHRPRR
jgi:DNA polymerase-1